LQRPKLRRKSDLAFFDKGLFRLAIKNQLIPTSQQLTIVMGRSEENLKLMQTDQKNSNAKKRDPAAMAILISLTLLSTPPREFRCANSLFPSYRSAAGPGTAMRSRN